MTKRRKVLVGTALAVLLVVILVAALRQLLHDNARPAAPTDPMAAHVASLHQLQGETFVRALRQHAATGSGDQKPVVEAILGNYVETRRIASNWSGLYWGFAWVSAALGALAGVLLKLESFSNERFKKDCAALFSVTAAILITVSTGGEFQRKWQANRTASAEIEHLGYDYLATPAPEAKAYFTKLGEILLRRQQSIIGNTEPKKPSSSIAD